VIADVPLSVLGDPLGLLESRLPDAVVDGPREAVGDAHIHRLSSGVSEITRSLSSDSSVPSRSLLW
jgi:hypothetical protein